MDGNQVKKIDLKTDQTLAAGVYPAWHPKRNIIAYSVNKTYQVFHTKNLQKVEVMDFASDLILYDVENNRVYDIDRAADEFESFPAWVVYIASLVQRLETTCRTCQRVSISTMARSIS